MNPRVLLCVDKECIDYPAMIGLPDEMLRSQPWLVCTSEAEEARKLANMYAFEQAWIVTCSDMAPINVSAGIKHDHESTKVVLVTHECNGSCASRAACAHIDQVWDKQMLLEAYHKAKNDYMSTAINRQFNDDSQQISDANQRSNAYGFTETFDRKAIQCVSNRQSQSLVISVVSASGGVGKSTVSVMISVLSSSLGLKTILVDGDLQFGDVHELMGIAQPIRIDEVLSNPDAIQQLERDRDTCAVLAAPVRAEMSEEITPQMYRVIELVCGRFDVVVVNTGSFWGDVQAQLLEMSDKVLFLLDQRPSSLRSCVHALELCSRMGIATHPFRFAINCFVKNGLVSSVDASCALRGAHVAELDFGGHEVDDILGAGYPLELLNVKNSFIDSLKYVTKELLCDAFPQQAEDLVHVKSFSLFRKRGR